MSLFVQVAKEKLHDQCYRQLFGYHSSSIYFLLCSTEERNPYKLGTDAEDKLIHFWVNYPWSVVNLDHVSLYKPMTK